MRWLSTAINNSSNADEAKNLPLQIGSRQTSVGDVFNISGNFSDTSVTLENSNQKMDYVGHTLPNNIELNVTGDVGHYAGAALKGGALKIQGNVCDYAGCEMSKGTIEISKNAGDYLGGAKGGK